MTAPIVKPHLLATHLALIRGSVNSQAYRHLYAFVDGAEQDIVKDGAHACAFFVTHILLWSQLLKEPHATVRGTIRDLLASGWEATPDPLPGDVLVWEPKDEAGEIHEHIGFFMGSDRAISNSTSQASPQEHHLTYGTQPDSSPVRAIITCYTHPRLRE
ncbi:hypothetical protein KBD13_01200 [Patescibacteria group bacterium]|nr:hypothetical protein [Patescibacteria group bacterium]MDQ5919920.1 hypothetical protein [Patescibacteria group bacterium]